VRARVLAGALALAALWPLPALAKPVAQIDGGTVLFYNDSLGIVVRNGVTLHLADGRVASGDAAFVDLRGDRAVIAGNAQITRGTTTIHADALAFDLPARKIDVLRSDTGIMRTDGTLRELQAAPDDGDAFAFPDLVDRRAYIRARHADIVSRTSVRFRPAAFPTSTGAPPVPMYLYTFAAGNGFAATALSSAAFDQPYGLVSTPNSLTAMHLRYINGLGASLGIEQNIIDNNDGFLAGALDVPSHAGLAEGLNGYRRLGEDGTVSLGATTVEGFHQATLGFTQAIGTLVGRLNYGITNLGASSAIVSLRTRDRVLFYGITWHTSVNFGFLSQDGGVYPLAPNPAKQQTVWQHGIDVFLASPLVHGPLRTTLSVTVDGSHTDYSYPHHFNALETNFIGSRRLSRTLTLFFGYDTRWSADIFPNAQTIFFPPVPAQFGYAGYVTSRLANIDVQYVQGPYTSVRLSYRKADDFPQVNFFAGRPPNEVRADVRIRFAANIGFSFGRSYDFGWNGSRWVPGWNFSVFQ
jgi:hypothetical protein